MLSEDMLYLPIRELGDRIRKRTLSPVDLAESYLERSRLIGPKLNAYATLTPELALKQARDAEAEIKAGHYRGPLHGIPYAAKDLVAVTGYPTTWGAPPFADRKFDYNATVIERLNQAGAVLIGKAAMIELAGGLGYSNGEASLTGGARNPWNNECWTCGSSSGSGAIVSAGLAPWAIGSDTRGSIICPTSWCGISGMRPSFGRVSRWGAMAIAWSMDKLGPMARTADCCGLALSVMAGYDSKDHDSLPDAAFSYQPARKGGQPLRIGKLTNAWSRYAPGMEQAIDDALKAMEKNGAKISDAQVPEGPYEDAAELTILIEAASSFQDMIHSGTCARLKDPLGQINGYISEEISASDYLQVQRVRTILQHRFDKLFDSFDVLATASSSSTASPLVPPPRDPSRQNQSRPNPPRYNDRPDNAQRAPDGFSSLCGLPALSVPCGFSKDNMPFGIQFIGRALNDHAVIDAARAYQGLTDWHKRHPAT